MTINFKGIGVAVLLFSFLLAGCTSSSLIVALDVAEVAASSAVPVIDAFAPQLGAPTVTLATNYAKAVSTACSESVAELSSTDSKAVQDTKIAGYFASAVISLPAGVASEVQAVIDAVGAAVQVILTEVHASATPTVANETPADSPGRLVRRWPLAGSALLAKYQAQVKALGSSKARLEDIRTRAGQMNGH